MRASGGMGATTLAINAAYVLTQTPGASAPRVCLLDLDPQFGNAALCLDLAHGHGLVDIVRSPARLDGELLRGAMLPHRSGLHVLTTPNIPMPLEALHPEVVEQIIDVAQREFDYVIIDLPRALTNWTEVVLVRSAMLALVVQLTVPALRQARRLIDLLQEEGHYALPLAVVLNRYARKWNDFLGTKEAEKALGRKVDHVIANDFELVSSALNEGLPAAAINRRGKFSRNVEEMVEATLARMRAADVSALAQ
jgi:pilus assembly protein CpaE